MNLQLMQPSPYTASGVLVFVFCKRCGKTCSGADVLCDLDAAAGTYYCTGCAVVLEMRS